MQSLVSYDSDDSSIESELISHTPKKLKESRIEEFDVQPYEDVCNKQEGLDSREISDNSEIDPSIELQEMGFPPELVAAAIKACGKSSPPFVLIDFIEAAKLEESTLHSQLDCCKAGTTSQEIEQNTTPLKRLESMGFSPIAVQNASEACGSIDFDDLLEHLINDVQQSEEKYKSENEMEWPDEEGSGEEDEYKEVFPFKKLERMGFTTSAIENAIESCDSIDFEALLSFLIDGEKFDLQKESNSHHQEYKGKKISKHSVKISRTFQVTKDTGPSSRVNWADETTLKLWYSYLGLRTKVRINAVADFDESDDEGLQWQEVETKNVRSLYQNTDCVRPMIYRKGTGFGVPGFLKGRPKLLNSLMTGPPFFYFENVESVPKSEWETIKRHFNGVDPEFTDSKYFSASHRPRGYVHNLPVNGRKLIIPAPPMTIFEALPDTAKYWPAWDTREKLNCINTRRASDSLCGLIRKIFSVHQEKGKEIPHSLQQEIIRACKRWNLVWVGPGQAAPLEPHEIELLLGYDRDHTRGCSSTTHRYDALGNSFQINTVAYHLSPLKELYPEGLTVLSLFSGIGGAEVALHKLGIRLKTVVVVEINVKTRNIIASWWRKTGQTGNVLWKDDVRDLTDDKLAEIVDSVGRIDLIIGGSPCNNLSGNNRVSRVGLSGKESCLFFEFPRILHIVKQLMQERGYI